MNKKGQTTLGNAPVTIQILLILAVTLAVSALIIAGFRTQGVTFVVTSVVNETMAISNTANTTFAVNIQEGLTGTTIVANQSDASIFPLSNATSALFVITEGAGVGRIQSINATWNGTSTYNVTYNFNADPEDHVSNITEQGLAGIQQVGDFQDLIALVVVAIIILGLVAFIGSRGNR